jgi:cyclic pyranopterin phosphate synthase
MEADRDARRRAVQAQGREDVLRLIEASRHAREILFTSGEPTTNPDLPLYVHRAAQAGYRVVGVISNGRRFAHEPYARHLLAAGANQLVISLHAPDARGHDALTRTPGSFDQTLAGLCILSRLRAQHDFQLQTSTVVTRRNLPQLQELLALFEPLAIDRHILNVMMPDGRGAQHLDALMPRYTEVRDALAGLLPRLSGAMRDRLALVDIPYCTTEGLPDPVRGYVERYFHYEADGALEERAARSGVEVPAGADERLFRPGSLEGEGGALTLVTRSFQEQLLRVFRDECAACRHRPRCHGVWRPYVERFGWDELRPVPR